MLDHGNRAGRAGRALWRRQPVDLGSQLAHDGHRRRTLDRLGRFAPSGWRGAPFMRWAELARSDRRRRGTGGLGRGRRGGRPCSLELAAAGTVALSEVLPAMLRANVAVGLSEALLTAALVAAFQSS